VQEALEYFVEKPVLAAQRQHAGRSNCRRANGECLGSFKTAWDIANGHDTKRTKPGARVDRAKLQQIDLHWHDLRHEGACRLHADGVDIRIIQLMLGHASVQQTQRYLNVTDEELRKGLEISWKRRTLKMVAGGHNA
jgi:integrase